MTNLPFRITLSKKQTEILIGMQEGYKLEWCHGVREDWYWLRKNSGEVSRISRISNKIVTALEQKGMIMIDPEHNDLRSRKWILTERGKEYQIKK